MLQLCNFPRGLSVSISESLDQDIVEALQKGVFLSEIAPSFVSSG